MSNKKRKLKEDATPKTLAGRYIGPKIAFLVVLVGTAIGASNIFNTSPSEKITIASIEDKKEDEYKDGAPLFKDGKLVTVLENGTIIFVNKSSKSKDKMYDAFAISQDGEFVQGLIGEEYFEEQATIKKEELENYIHVYEVAGADAVNIRSNTKLDKDSKIGTIAEGMEVIGADRIVSKDNDFMWVPVITEDEKGKIVQAYICYDYLKELDSIDIPFEEAVKKKMIVNTTSKTLNMRSEAAKEKDNIIFNLPNNAIIETTGRDDRIADSMKWREVSYVDENGQRYTGWVRESALEDYDIVQKKVNTNKAKGINLNVRIKPGTSSKKIADIENGTVVNVFEGDIDSMTNVDGMDWVRIVLNDGSYGYVAYQYLDDITKKQAEERISDQELEKVFSKIRINPNNDVVGIDISGLSGKQLKELLTDKKAIPSELYRMDDDKETLYDTSDLAGKIDFVYIKIGARGYGKKGTLIDYGDIYIEQAKICEELGIPYGFYYYSTSLKETEADEEIAYVKKALKSLKGKTKYNVLPFALDVESEVNSRVYKKDLTNVMAYWANQAESVTGKVILYSGARNIANNSGDRLIDLEEFNKRVISGPTKLWVAALRVPDNTDIYGQKYIYDLTSRELPISIYQTMLDGYNKEFPKGDIDVINENEFKQIIIDRVNEIREKNHEEEVKLDDEDKKLKTPFGALKELLTGSGEER